MTSQCVPHSPLFCQNLYVSDGPPPAHLIPHSVVHFQSNSVTRELISGLLATRSKRNLQSLHVHEINETDVAALVGELVGTDPDKEWKCVLGRPSVDATSVFCRAAMSSPSAARPSSLTGLSATVASTTLEAHKTFAKLFAAHTGLRHFDVETIEGVGTTSHSDRLFDY